MCGFNPCIYKFNKQEKNDKEAASSTAVAKTAVCDNEPNSEKDNEDKCSEERNKADEVKRYYIAISLDDVKKSKDQKELNDIKYKYTQQANWNDKKRDQEKVKKVLKYAGIGLASACIAVAAAVPVIGVVGFTSVGVAGGSLAAMFQSSFLGGIIAKGSFFALLQSAGATGAIAGTSKVIIGGTAAGLATGVTKAATEIKATIKKKTSKLPLNPSSSPCNKSTISLPNNSTTVKRQKVKMLIHKNDHPLKVSTNSSIRLYLHV